MLTIAALKQEIIKINNQVNIDHYGYGVKRQKVYLIDGEVILIVANNKRVSALEILDKQGYSTAEVNNALMKHYKAQLCQSLEEQLGLKIQSVGKDYDNGTETAFTVILLAEAVNIV